MLSFFLGGRGDNRINTWIKWDTICSRKKKKKGGLWFRRLEDFNLAILSKWYWRKGGVCGIWSYMLVMGKMGVGCS